MRGWKGGVLAAALCAAASAATGQTFPNRPLRVVVPYPSGGSPDVLARTVAHKVSERLGQQIVVDNRPGAGGIVAAETVVRAAPDGYTLLIADSSVYSIGPNVQQRLPYDLQRDLAPVTLAASSPLFLAANGALPVQNLRDFVALARAKPGMPYASSGVGTGHHLAMELLKSLAGIELTHVPYKGAGQSVPALVSGDVAVAFAGLNLLQPQAKAGKIRLLGVATGQRSALLPEMPTLAEAGVPGFDVNITLGFFLPAKAPAEIVARLNGELNAALASADVRERLFALGVEPVGTTPERFAAAIRAELDAYGRLVKSAGVRVE